MAKIWVGPAGKTVRGHLLDVSVTGFSDALRELDPRLYVKWNPAKLRGHGCWEIRIKPSKKTALYQCTLDGVDWYELDYLEFDSVHHVLDCAFLNYDAIRKLKEMDMMKKDHFVHDLEYREQMHNNALAKAAHDERLYELRQHKSALRDLYERARSGENIHRIIAESPWALKADGN